jgi:membrane protein implicated in regulation of membrane protease activity
MLEVANALVLMLLGAMLFFPAVVAPVVFTSLPEAQAGAFLRSMFPRYYAFMIALSLIAALLFLAVSDESAYQAAIVCVFVGVSTLWVRQWLLPRINTARDAQLAGDIKAGRRFDREHKLSVGINLLQLVLLVGIQFV